jgi:CheY-like chemotaxis protein
MAGPGGPRVLVVDDMEALRAIIRRVLTDSGYRVDAAASIPEARAMDPRGYDAVVVDAYLGEERGAVLIDALRAEDPAAAGRCLMITGRGAGVIPPGVAYLIKPFSPDDLLTAVRALVQPGSAGRPGNPPAGGPPAGGPAGGGPSAGGRAAGGRAAGVVAPDRRRPGPGPQAAAVTASPAAPQTAAWPLLGLVRELRAAQGDAVAGLMHDGPVQELTAALLGLQTLARRAPDDLAPRFGQLLDQLKVAARSIPQVADEGVPLIAPEDGLPAAVRQRTAWLPFSSVRTDVQPAQVIPGPEVPALVDVIELALFVLADLASGPAQVRIQAGEQATEILLTLTPAGDLGGGRRDPAAVQLSLTQLARALGGTARGEFSPSAWQARIRLPRPPAA